MKTLILLLFLPILGFTQTCFMPKTAVHHQLDKDELWDWYTPTYCTSDYLIQNGYVYMGQEREENGQGITTTYIRCDINIILYVTEYNRGRGFHIKRYHVYNSKFNSLLLHCNEYY